MSRADVANDRWAASGWRLGTVLVLCAILAAAAVAQNRAAPAFGYRCSP